MDEIREARQSRGIEFLDELKQYRTQIAARIHDLQKTDLADAGRLQQEIIGLQGKINSTLSQEQADEFTKEYLSFDADSVETGDAVFIVPLKTEGVLREIDRTSKSAHVMLGSIQSRYSFDALLLPKQKRTAKKPTVKKPAPQPKHDSTIALTIQTSYNTADLRGMRVDEAISKMELELDRMMRTSIDTAVVIHGHGTGALKEAVRAHLKHSTYAKNFRRGEQNEGGDGVTIVALNV